MAKNSNRRPLAFKTLEESLEEIRRLKNSGYEKAGSWNLDQICQHLNKTMRTAFDGAEFGLPGMIRPVVRVIFMRIVKKGKQVNMSATAPPQLVPEESIDLEKEIQEYESLIERYNQGESEIKHRHPIIGKLSADQWKSFHAWHAAHHLSFLIPDDSPD